MKFRHPASLLIFFSAGFVLIFKHYSNNNQTIKEMETITINVGVKKFFEITKKDKSNRIVITYKINENDKRFDKLLKKQFDLRLKAKSKHANMQAIYSAYIQKSNQVIIENKPLFIISIAISA